jgi:hypothetical protein
MNEAGQDCIPGAGLCKRPNVVFDGFISSIDCLCPLAEVSVFGIRILKPRSVATFKGFLPCSLAIKAYLERLVAGMVTKSKERKRLTSPRKSKVPLISGLSWRCFLGMSLLFGCFEL